MIPSDLIRTYKTISSHAIWYINNGSDYRQFTETFIPVRLSKEMAYAKKKERREAYSEALAVWLNLNIGQFLSNLEL